jgi:hypothetical protein
MPPRPVSRRLQWICFNWRSADGPKSAAAAQATESSAHQPESGSSVPLPLLVCYCCTAVELDDAAHVV